MPATEAWNVTTQGFHHTIWDFAITPCLFVCLPWSPMSHFLAFNRKKTNDNVNPKPSTLGMFTPFPQGLPSWCRGCVGWQVAWITWNFNYNVNCPDFRCQACILDLSSDYSQFKIGCWTYVCAFQIIDAWLHIVIYDYIPRGSMYGIFTYIDPQSNLK